MVIIKQIIAGILLFGISFSLSPAVGDIATRIAREYSQTLEQRVFECVNGQRVRIYFNAVDWVEVRCVIAADNLWLRELPRNISPKPDDERHPL